MRVRLRVRVTRRPPRGMLRGAAYALSDGGDGDLVTYPEVMAT